MLKKINSILDKHNNEGEKAFSLKYEAGDSSRWNVRLEFQSNKKETIDGFINRFTCPLLRNASLDFLLKF